MHIVWAFFGQDLNVVQFFREPLVFDLLFPTNICKRFEKGNSKILSDISQIFFDAITFLKVPKDLFDTQYPPC